MATSGSYGLNGGGWSSTFSWGLSGQSIAGNSSTISWWWDANWSSTTYVYSSQAKLWVNGSQVFENGYNTSRRMYGGRQASGSIAIGHNTNGTKSFGANGEAAFYQFALNAWGSGSWDLPTIPRHASATGSSGDINDEQNPWLSYSNPARTAVDVYLELPDLGISPIPGSKASIGSAASGTYNWNLSDASRKAIRSAMKNVKSTKLRMGLHDSLGGDSWSWRDAVIYIVNGEPIFSDFEYQDTNELATEITGNNKVLIQSVSVPEVIISLENQAAPQKEAAILRYNIAFDGRTTSLDWNDTGGTSVVLGTATNAGDMKLKVSALDSRSFIKDVSKDVYVIPYSSPIVVASGRRLNDFEDETTIHIEGSIAPIYIGDEPKNTVDTMSGVQYRFREQGSSAWGDWKNVQSAIGANGVIGTTDFILSLDKTKAYEFQVQISDKLKTSTADFTVGVGQPIFRIGVNDKLCYNNEQPLMTSHVGQVIQSTALDTAEKVAAVYGGTWVTWGAGRVPVGVSSGDADFGTVNKTGGDKTVTLTVDQMPSHRHGWYGLNDGAGWTGHAGTYPFRIYQDREYNWGGSEHCVKYAGGDQAHPNLQPYVTCYFWRRTV